MAKDKNKKKKKAGNTGTPAPIGIGPRIPRASAPTPPTNPIGVSPRPGPRIPVTPSTVSPYANIPGPVGIGAARAATTTPAPAAPAAPARGPMSKLFGGIGSGFDYVGRFIGNHQRQSIATGIGLALLGGGVWAGYALFGGNGEDEDGELAKSTQVGEPAKDDLTNRTSATQSELEGFSYDVILDDNRVSYRETEQGNILTVQDGTYTFTFVDEDGEPIDWTQRTVTSITPLEKISIAGEGKSYHIEEAETQDAVLYRGKLPVGVPRDALYNAKDGVIPNANKAYHDVVNALFLGRSADDQGSLRKAVEHLKALVD